ncbi:ABC transporter substrate-binding protein [Rubritalea tangerina]|uniref:ABC transporter substrate-binding protein n=2 Tax=Rubritalea tangerina TaxID=430798 RepID=A0ABW4ZF38_9BACT
MQRRNFLNIIGASSVLTPLALQAASGKPSTKKLQLAGYDYDRLRMLSDKKAEITGYEYDYKLTSIGEANSNTFSGPQDYDVTEIGLHPYMLAYANDGFRGYSLLPIFPVRIFRHKSIFIRTDRGIDKPEDLKGKKIATPGFSSTSLTWIRGILQHEYNISMNDVEWIVAKTDSSADIAGKASAQERVIPKGLKFTEGSAGKDESQLLEDGDVDALLHAAEPRCYVQGHPKVARLFDNVRATESAYYKKTGIFPIMHAVAVRNSLVESDPSIIQSIFKAYSESKSAAQERLAKLGWVDSMLPWLGQEMEETYSLLGKDYWSYGIEKNRKTLEALFAYSHEQGLCKKHLKIEDLFHPASLTLKE